jgi:excisionase family DNA binding protein
LPVEKISAVIALLATRLIEQAGNGAHEHRAAGSAPANLLTAGELAERLNLPESWIRSEERLGRIPSIRAGKYVRFKLTEVEPALARSPRQARRNR